MKVHATSTNRIVFILALLFLTYLSNSSLTNAEKPIEDNWGPHHNRATITTSLVHLEPGEKQWFKSVMVATRLMAADVPQKTNWTVNDIPGGNKIFGIIDQNGVYIAPAVAPSPREIHIGAEVPEAANKQLYATVIIGAGEPVYTSVHSWSEKNGAPETRITGPHGIGLDKDGNILIAAQGASSVLRYSKTGEFIDRIDSGSGRNPGEVTKPREVTSDADGRIFVTDSKGDRPRVQVWSHTGKFQQIFAEKGRWQGMLLRAHGMDFDHHRRLFIVDVDNMAIKVFDKKGNSLYDWGEEGLAPGQFNAPHGLFVDRAGDVFVTGYYGPTQKFSPEGDFITAFGHGDPPNGPVYFHSVAGDKWGNAYLSVRGKDGYDGAIEGLGEGRRISIMKYNNNGTFVTAWSYSEPEHSESEVTVADDGTVYALFNGPEDVGVETFLQK